MEFKIPSRIIMGRLSPKRAGNNMHWKPLQVLGEEEILQNGSAVAIPMASVAYNNKLPLSLKLISIVG